MARFQKFAFNKSHVSVWTIPLIRGKSSVQKQPAALSGLENTKENCGHASAERSKAFSLQGKYLKANIQLTLLLLQTPVTSRCSILACRVVQRRADRCLDKNIFLYSPQGAFRRKRGCTAPSWVANWIYLFIYFNLLQEFFIMDLRFFCVKIITGIERI